MAALADLNDRVAAERETLAREQAAVAEATRNPARKRLADSAVAAVGARVFTGANDVAASATLATYLGDVARRTHVWLANATTRAATSSATPGRAGGATAAITAITGGAGGRGGRGPAAPPLAEGVHPLRVELRAESDFQGVLDFLTALERGDKLVTIERLDVARTLRVGDEERETLSITATVVGYALVSPATSATTPAGRGAVATGRAGTGGGR
jgi:hypothetical protein